MKKRKLSRKRIKTIAKKCLFCTEKKEPWYSEVETLRRFVSERGKIMPRTRSGNCAKHQRQVTMAIKHARHLALLPFVGR